MKPLELGPLLKEKIKHLKTVLFSVAHHDLPFAVPNAVLIVYNPIAIKSSNGRGEQEDHHDDNGDGQLGQEGGIHFSHKLQKGEKKFNTFRNNGISSCVKVLPWPVSPWWKKRIRSRQAS